MQISGILNTKLNIPPRRPKLIPRPRLMKLLNNGRYRRLTLISAPAGYGKTTLISDWAEALQSKPTDAGQVEHKVAWYSLDEDDNDLVHFLTYLIAALFRAEGIEPVEGDGLLKMLQFPEPPSMEPILTALINRLEDFPDRILVVLDDYHLIDAASVNDALAFMIDHLPGHVHLVISTRADPELSLARLRAQGQLSELRGADLRFTTNEAIEFLNGVMGLDLSAQDVAALDSRTEGWIAGLQLAAISMQGLQDTAAFIKAFTGSHYFVLDYLIEEVLEKQSGDIQRFLVMTSIPDRLCGSLCNALTGQEDSQAILEFLENSNLFIVPLDSERRWYRYHHLFVDLLHQRLNQTAQAQIPALHREASKWYARNGYPDEAVEHAMRGGDFEIAADLIEANVDTVWRNGEHTKLRRWLAGLPAGLLHSNPHLCIIHAWDLFTSGQQEAAEQSLLAAEQALVSADHRPATAASTDPPKLPESEEIILQGRAAAIRAFLAFYRGDIDKTSQFSLRALELLPKQDLTWYSTATVALGDAYACTGELEAAFRVRSKALRASHAAGNLYMTLISSMKLAETLRQQGHLTRVIETCRDHFQLAEDYGLSQTVAVGWLLSTWGEVLAEMDDLDSALAQAEKGTGLTACGRDVAMIGWSYLCLVRVLFTRGNLEGAQETLRELENVGRRTHVPPWIMNRVAAWQVRIWMAQDESEAASRWLAQRNLDPAGCPTYMQEAEYIALARILIAQGRGDETAEMLKGLLEKTELRGHFSRMLEVLILQALAAQAEGDPEHAIRVIDRAFTIARPRGFIHAFVDEGPQMARLLLYTAAKGVSPRYSRQLLTAFPATEVDEVRLMNARICFPGLIEPLSDRELEVLELVAEGLANREIADRLCLSLNTVKVHTRNIYGKLGVNNRTHAVAQARSLGIISLV
jgi:LuxR family maltose regulon positive regulatory protein